MITKIIDLHAGPGTGKSTSAALLYAKLKQDGANAELVREYVKDWAWESRKISAYDQLYFLGKQTRRESMLYGKVDYIVTDSPMLLGIYYSQTYCPPLISEGIRAATVALYRQAEADGYRHFHVFLRRSKPYNPAGRFQNETEAKDVDVQVKRILNELKIPFMEADTDESSLNEVLRKVREA